MDVAHPSFSMAPALDVVALEALAGVTAPLTLTDVVNAAGTGSPSGHLKALRRLVAAGLVTRQGTGYTLNRQHVLAEAVRSMASARAQVLRRIKDHAAGWEQAPDCLAVFGSFARRDGDADSDVDVVVVGRSTKRLDEQVLDLAEAIRAWTGNHAQVVTVSRADLTRMRRHQEPILTSWRDDAIVLVGDARLIQ